MTQPVSRPAAHPAAAPGHRLASGATQAENAARVTKAAQDFTAVALGEMLKPMFDTLDSSGGPFGGGQGEQAWRPMMIDEIAKSIARQGGLGLSGPVAQAMLQMQEKAR